MNFEHKIISYEQIERWRASLGAQARPLVVTNGCFDVIHPGHASLLSHARTCGNTLMVGLTCDEEVRKLKGPNRPAIPQADRAKLIAALGSVSAVSVFPEADACAFIRKCLPDIYVKGGDYTIDSINQDERRLMESLGVPIHFLPRFETRSSSVILNDFLQVTKEARV